ncbi:MAG: S24 family peptidase [Phocaeicola sp.]
MADSIKGRLIKFIESKNTLSVRSFESKCSLSNGFVNSTGDSIRKASLEKISTRYPDLNTNWLITGEGSMLKGVEYDTTDEVHILRDDEPKISHTTGVPYYNVDFLGGFDVMMNDQTQHPEYRIDFKKYNEADCWCNVTGHSMEPEITHGDIIAMKKLEDWELFIPYGEVYAIVASNGLRTIKRIGPGSSTDVFSLIPTNKSPEYGTQEIPKKLVAGVWKVLGCMKRL